MLQEVARELVLEADALVTGDLALEDKPGDED